MIQSLIERELRNAMAREKLQSLPLYPEGRACLHPTTHQVIEVFEVLQRHTLQTPEKEMPTTFPTELATIHQQILRLLNGSEDDYYGV